jgi:hypothetical protein
MGMMVSRFVNYRDAKKVVYANERLGAFLAPHFIPQRLF